MSSPPASPVSPSARIYVAGHRGLVGSALVRALHRRRVEQPILRTRDELDLLDARAVDRFFASERPEYVFLAAARVGGIIANSTKPADFIRENLGVQLNVIDAAYRHVVRKLLFFGSACIYPRLPELPIREEALLTGPLEPTNEAYAVAKIAGLKMCQAYNAQYGTNFVSVMPTNLYGPGDSFDPQGSHVIPALMRRFHEAKVSDATAVVVWGTGRPRREFMYVDDLAEASLVIMDRYDGSEIINVGTGQEVSIQELASLIARIVDYNGRVEFDSSKPDGMPRRVLDISRLKSLGWQPRTRLEDGLRQTYHWYYSKADDGA
jgi:GDP-L-fucose synthase